MSPDLVWIGVVLFLLLAAGGWIYTHYRINNVVKTVHDVRLSVAQIETQVSRFISHEESERGTRERANGRIAEQFKGLSDQCAAMNTALLLIQAEMARYNKQAESWNAFVTNLSRRPPHDELR